MGAKLGECFVGVDEVLRLFVDVEPPSRSDVVTGQLTTV
jgi:hypothetical protein